MKNFVSPLCWAIAMIALALLARLGLADRDAVITVLMVMPILAFVTMQRRRCCGTEAREA